MADLPETGPKLRLGRRFHPIAAAASIGVAVAVSAWLAVSVWEQRLAQAAFTDVAGDYAAALQNGLDDYVNKLTDVRAFYDASAEVAPDEFKLFTGRILQGIASEVRITWSPLVTSAERPGFEAKADQSGLEGYRIKAWAADGAMPPAPEGEEYFPVLYATNVPKGASTFGVDLESEPIRRKTIERARDDDRMAAALDVVLSNEGKEERRGFFVTLPVYRQGLPQATVAERRENILGILGATFQTDTILAAILKNAALPQNVDLYLYPAQGGPAPAYMRASPLLQTPLKPISLSELEKAPHWSGVLKVGDASWNLVVTPMKGGLTSFYRAWIVLVIVVLVFGGVLAYMLATMRNALRLERVNRKVIELARTDL
jgi:CHASE1-domain containing sensor protein